MSEPMEITNNMFIKYLVTVPRHEAVNHFIECLIAGGEDNAAWQIMEHVHGDWSCPPKELPKLVNETIEAIKLEGGLK